MNYAIIVAGGTGSRMQADLPKQFLILDGLPVIMHTINAFQRCRSAPRIILVVHPHMQEQWKALCETYGFTVPHTLCSGGISRFESVKRGLAVVSSMTTALKECYIAVHDAARPLIAPQQIDDTYAKAVESGAVALAIPSSNSVRLKSANNLKNNAFNRKRVFLMQTPQTFRGDILADAYTQEDDDTFTDDASVVERKGYPISLVDGDTHNIKITFPEDLQIAHLLLETRSAPRAKLRP